MLTPSQVVRSLGPIDIKSLRRDAMLRWLVLYPIVLGAAARWGVPPLTAWLATRYGFELTPYYPLIASFLVLVTPALMGCVIGFLLLDERDDRTLMALQVTPLTVNGYLVYRATVPMLLSVVMTMLLIPLAGLVSMGLVSVLLVALCAAPVAPLYAVFVATYAANKVQGFALMKGLGVLAWPPMFAYFVSPPWQWAFGLDPLYWPAKVFWMVDARESGLWLAVAAGLLYQLLLLSLLLRRFDHVVHRS